MPISPTIITAASTGVPRKTAASEPHPDAEHDPDHRRAEHEPERHRRGLVTCGITFAPRLTNDVRSRVMKSFFIISAYWTGIGRSSPKSLRTARSVGLVGVPAGDARRRVDARRREEDQERRAR